MNCKNAILDSWIMVEHLSEGEISNEVVEAYQDSFGDDFYNYIIRRIDRKNLKEYKNPGFIIYIDVFELGETIRVLRKKSGWIVPEEEPDYGQRFSLALCFSIDFELYSDMTFFTACGYIKHESRLPTAFEELLKAEDRIKTKYKILFDECFKDISLEENGDASNDLYTNSSSKRVLDPAMFDSAIISVMKDFNTDIDSCRFSFAKNIESQTSLMHSFYIEDLNNAKKVSTSNLDKYLLGGDPAQRINLDSNNRTESFTHNSLETILNPKNYPLGKFPSNIENCLYLMQQVAVNLSVGYDNSQIRSVNGPPGTGKTTLLKDIFAELIVKQAYEICKLDCKYIYASNELIFYNRGKLGKIPQSIAENGIVVASSNNSAVQNIVNEIPLASKIDKGLIYDLNKADYFKDIANTSIICEFDKEITQSPVEEERWGLFSLEGGKYENRQSLLEYLKKVINDLEAEEKKAEYENNNNIYKVFLDKYYNYAVKQRDEIQKIAETYKNLSKNKNELQLMKKDFIEENKRREVAFEKAKCETESRIFGRNETASKIESNLTNKISELELITTNKNNAIDSLKVLMTPKFVSFIKSIFDNDFKNNISRIKNTISELMNKEKDLNNEIFKLKRQIDDIFSQNEKDKENMQSEKTKLDEWFQNKLREQYDLEDTIRDEEKTIKKRKVKTFNANQDYDDFQKSNPWSDVEYRKVQSDLFILALRVRKQFLYENRKHIKNAVTIWDFQSKYDYKQEVIEAAWEWINLVIPVISTTFASFGQMFRRLGKNTIGYLFIDEAGQAIPQAAVGAIFRSKNVIVVGDPAQIKPVYNLEANVLNEIGQSFGVTDDYLSESVSVQSLADRASGYGYYRDKDSWVGIPLWVHRRCEKPMFDISNKLSYKNLMVQAEPEYGLSGWYDIKGVANDKYVEEQGNKLYELINKRIIENKEIIDKKEDTIYVISPFKNVANKLANKLDSLGFVRRDKEGNPTNVGTIHTFQGKEAPIVYLVLGADNKSKGAARWAVSEPNMMNVAASRAKKEFYIIGDYDLYNELNTSVIKDTIHILNNYKKDHPDKSI